MYLAGFHEEARGLRRAWNQDVAFLVLHLEAASEACADAKEIATRQVLGGKIQLNREVIRVSTRPTSNLSNPPAVPEGMVERRSKRL